MHYPINAAAHIAALQEQFRGREKLVEFCRDYLIPAMNAAYQDGKAGASGYMLDPAAEIAAFENTNGPLTDQGKRRIAAFIRCLNTAYEQGAAEALHTPATKSLESKGLHLIGTQSEPGASGRFGQSNSSEWSYFRSLLLLFAPKCTYNTVRFSARGHFL